MVELVFRWSPSQPSARVSGFQAAQLGIASQLRAWREQLDPREYAALVDILGLFLERERRRLERVSRRRHLTLVR